MPHAHAGVSSFAYETIFCFLLSFLALMEKVALLSCSCCCCFSCSCCYCCWLFLGHILHRERDDTCWQRLVATVQLDNETKDFSTFVFRLCLLTACPNVVIVAIVASHALLPSALFPQSVELIVVGVRYKTETVFEKTIQIHLQSFELFTRTLRIRVVRIRIVMQ